MSPAVRRYWEIFEELRPPAGEGNIPPGLYAAAATLVLAERVDALLAVTEGSNTREALKWR